MIQKPLWTYHTYALLKFQINQDKLQKAKREAVEKRLRKSHPLRKSLAGMCCSSTGRTLLFFLPWDLSNDTLGDPAESGTLFENGVRRSKRIRMRPLEYWKGERFLYGRLDESEYHMMIKIFYILKQYIFISLYSFVVWLENCKFSLSNSF